MTTHLPAKIFFLALKVYKLFSVNHALDGADPKMNARLYERNRNQRNADGCIQISIVNQIHLYFVPSISTVAPTRSSARHLFKIIWSPKRNFSRFFGKQPACHC
jgi:hypothetical protein